MTWVWTSDGVWAALGYCHTFFLQFLYNCKIKDSFPPDKYANLISDTYVDEVTLAVQHDIAIVSVFNLQQEQKKAVGSHTANEVIPSLEKEREKWCLCWLNLNGYMESYIYK